LGVQAYALKGAVGLHRVGKCSRLPGWGVHNFHPCGEAHRGAGTSASRAARRRATPAQTSDTRQRAVGLLQSRSATWLSLSRASDAATTRTRSDGGDMFAVIFR